MLRSRKVAARTLGDETMIMSAVDSSLFTLNDDGVGDLERGGRSDSAG